MDEVEGVGLAAAVVEVGAAEVKLETLETLDAV